MNKSEDNEDLREQIRQCLNDSWDPRNVRYFESVSDDYDACVDRIASLLLGGCDATAVLACLREAELTMGLSIPCPRAGSAAAELANLRLD